MLKEGFQVSVKEWHIKDWSLQIFNKKGVLCFLKGKGGKRLKRGYGDVGNILKRFNEEPLDWLGSNIAFDQICTHIWLKRELCIGDGLRTKECSGKVKETNTI